MRIWHHRPGVGREHVSGAWRSSRPIGCFPSQAIASAAP